jgi:hypothetical protein
MDREHIIGWLGFAFGVYLLAAFFIPPLAEPLRFIGLATGLRESIIVFLIALPAFLFLCFAYLLTGDSLARDWGITARNILLDSIATAILGLLFVMAGIIVAANYGIWDFFSGGDSAGMEIGTPIIGVFIGFMQILTSLRQLGYWKL